MDIYFQDLYMHKCLIYICFDNVNNYQETMVMFQCLLWSFIHHLMFSYCRHSINCQNLSTCCHTCQVLSTKIAFIFVLFLNTNFIFFFPIFLFFFFPFFNYPTSFIHWHSLSCINNFPKHINFIIRMDIAGPSSSITFETKRGIFLLN